MLSKNDLISLYKEAYFTQDVVLKVFFSNSSSSITEIISEPNIKLIFMPFVIAYGEDFKKDSCKIDCKKDNNYLELMHLLEVGSRENELNKEFMFSLIQLKDEIDYIEIRFIKNEI